MANPSVTRADSIRIAIGQLRMRWTGEENTVAILESLRRAAASGAQLCVLPELAVTGFHRRIRDEARPERVGRWIEAIRSCCAQHRIAASVGVPTFASDERAFNSNLFVDESGQIVGAVHKNGLTPAEATFFARGADRPVHSLLGHRCSAILCREVDDVDEVSSQLPHGSAELIFWPGAMRPAVDGSEPDPEAHVKKAQRLARSSGAYLVQANWPNSLNYPDESEAAGQSVVIDPTGQVVTRLPVAAAGLAIVMLGESRFEWYGEEA